MYNFRRCLTIAASGTHTILWKRSIKAVATRKFCSTNAGNDDNDKRETKKQPSSPKVPVLRSPFENVTDKTKEAYMDMVTIFENRDVHRRNHVEFIYAALKNMEAFGVHRDLEVYKGLINVMPKGKFIPSNMFQTQFMHYPKQQQCIIDLLEQMEDHGVIPDYEMEAMLLNVFGRRGHPLRKYWRMMYWMPKFKNLSPWPLPNPVPNDTLELATMAVERMCSVDLQSQVQTFQTEEVTDAVDQTWIVSGISPEQSALLARHDKTQPVYIEGPFMIWLRNRAVNYFTLRADPNVAKLKEMDDDDADFDIDDVSQIKVPLFGQPYVKESRIALKRSVHEQDDGTIFAICATGTSTKDSLLSWVRLLEKNNNPVLADIPVLFRFRSIVGSPLVPVSSDVSNLK